MKKFLSLLLTGLMAFSTTPAFAQFPGNIVSAPIASENIPASGVLAGGVSLTISILPNGSAVTNRLSFDSDLGNGEVAFGNLNYQAPQIVQVDFEASNEPGFQQIVITTDNTNAAANPKYTGAASPSGLVGVSDTTQAAGLLWTIFPTQSAAAAYTFIAEGNGAPNTTTQAFVTDKSDPQWNDSDANGPISNIEGYAATIFAIEGGNANISDFGASVGANRTVTNGQAFMRFAVAYGGVGSTGEYATSTLTLDMVTI